MRELYAYRELLWVLVWRDLKARYRGSVLGFLWTLLNPLLLMAIYSLVFAVYLRVDVPAYPVFVFSGLLPWIWFSSAVVAGGNAIIDSGHLIKRVVFPPQVLPAVVVTATLVNFLLALPLLFVFMLAFGVAIRPSVLALPVPIAILYLFLLGLTIGLSMLTVRYRDVGQLVANLLTLWFFLTPVLYPPSMVPAPFQTLLAANPMAVLVMAFQDCLYRGTFPRAAALGGVALLAVAMFMGSLALAGRLRWRLAEEV